MRGVWLVLFLAAWLAALPVCASAQMVTGNELLAKCQGDTVDRYWCSAYLQGVLNTLTNHCLPKEVTFGQAQDVIIRHLTAYPQVRHYPASNLIEIAIKQSFPCRR
jgi:hypothetical protein